MLFNVYRAYHNDQTVMEQANKQTDLQKYTCTRTALFSYCSWCKRQEALAIKLVFSLVDMITNTKFSNCILVF